MGGGEVSAEQAQQDAIALDAEPTHPSARVVDRDGDVWALHAGRWGCLTVASSTQIWSDLWHVCGPLNLAGANHPEDYCHRCGGPNVSWFTPPEAWDPIMRPASHDTTEWLWNEIICPVCFAELFEAKFPLTTFALTPDERTIGGRAFRGHVSLLPGQQVQP